MVQGAGDLWVWQGKRRKDVNAPTAEGAVLTLCKGSLLERRLGTLSSLLSSFPLKDSITSPGPAS